MELQTNVFITHVDKAGPILKLWAQTDRESPTLIERTINQLTEKFNLGIGLPDPAQLEEGKLVCAKYNDGVYYRARILSLASMHKGEVSVQFADYGNLETILTTNLRLLDNFNPLLTLTPDQATDMYLAGIVSLGSEWCPTSLKFVKDTICYVELKCVYVGMVGTKKLIKLFYDNMDFVDCLMERRIGYSILLDLQKTVLYNYLNHCPSPPLQLYPSYNPDVPPPLPIAQMMVTPSMARAAEVALQEKMALRAAQASLHMPNQRQRSPNLMPPPGLAQFPNYSQPGSTYALSQPAPSYMAPRNSPPTPPSPEVVLGSVSYLNKMMVAGKQYEVMIVSIEDGPLSFTVKLKEQEQMLRMLQMEINSSAPTALSTLPMVGTRCLAQDSVDKNLNRAVIKEVSHDHCSVYFVDFGQSEDVPLTQIFDIPLRFVTKYPVMAMQVTHGALSSIDVTKEVKDLFKKYTFGKYFNLFVVPSESHQMKQYGILYENKRGVLDVILDEIEARNAMKYIPVKKPKIGFNKMAVVSFVEEVKKFYIQLEDNVAALDSLMAELMRHCKNIASPVHLAELRPGLICCSQFVADDQWYRAEVIAIEKEDIYVNYVDFGNIDVVTINMLRSTTPAIVSSLPSQAIRCTLADYQNVANNDKLTNEFAELTEHKSLVMKVIGVCENGALSVNLADMTQAMPVLIDFKLQKYLAPVKQAPVKQAPVKQVPAAEKADRAVYRAPSGPAASSHEPREPSSTERSSHTGGSGDGNKYQRQTSRADSSADWRAKEGGDGKWRTEGNSRTFTPVKISAGETKASQLVFVDSPECFYLQLTPDLALCDIMADIASKYEGGTPKSLRSPSVGTACVAKFAEDGSWYRAVVRSVEPPRARVHFVDYGNEDEVGLEDVKEIEPTFLQFPSQGIKCALSGALPSGTAWSDEEIERFTLLADGKPLEVRFVAERGDTFLVTMKDAETDTVVNEAFSPKAATQAKSRGSYDDAKPKTSYEDKPRNSYDDKPKSSYNDTSRKTYDDKPRNSYDDKPRNTYDDKPRNTYDDKPRNTYDDKPRNTYDDKPRNSYDDKPRNTYDDKPRRRDDDKPRNTYDDKPRNRDDDKPRSSYDDKPRNNYDDKPRNSYDDKPKSNYEERKPRTYDDKPKPKPAPPQVFASPEEQYKCDDLSVGEVGEVCISWFINPGQFFVQRLSKCDQMERTMKDIQIAYKSTPSNGSHLAVGAPCIAKYLADGSLCRAEIVSKDSGAIIVRYVDFGNRDRLGDRNLWQIESRFLELPKQAIECGLPDILPPGEAAEWAVSSQETDKMFEREKYDCTFDQFDDVKYLVTLAHDGTNVRDELIAAGLAAAPVVVPEFVACLEEPVVRSLLARQTLQVEVTYVEGIAKLFVHLEGHKADVIQAQVDEYVLVPENMTAFPASLVVAGQLCLATADSEHWYRARITDPEGTAGVFVTFIDFGDGDEIQPDKQMTLIPDWLAEMPGQAVECSVNGSGAMSVDPEVEDQFKADLEGENIIVHVESVDANDVLDVSVYSMDGAKLELVAHMGSGATTVCPLLPAPVLAQKVRMFVSSSEGDNKVWLQRSADTDAIGDLVTLLYTYYQEESKGEPTTPSVGLVCAAKSVADEQWYRARVTALTDDGATVQYLDYGNSETLPTANLRSLDPEFMVAHCAALPATLPLENVSAVVVDLASTTAEVEYTAVFARGSDDQWLTELFTKKQALSDILQEQGLDSIPDYPFTEMRDEITSNAPLIAGQIIPCYVSHTDSPGEFYLQRASDEAEIEALQADLQESVELMPPLLPGIGDLCAALYMEDSAWYRAKVLSQEEEVPTVRFIDYGNTSKVDTVLKLLPHRLARRGHYALRCAANILPLADANEFSEEAIEQFTTMATETSDPITVEILSVGEPNYVDLRIDNTSIPRTLIEAGLVEEKFPENTIYISHTVSPSQFWIQFQFNFARLDRMADSMAEAEKFKPLLEPTDGMLCAAQFVDDDLWYRARVLGQESDGAKVLFVDYGNSAIATEVRTLPDELATPIELARRCKLAKAQQWTEEQITKFVELAADGTALFTVTIVNEGDETEVSLTDEQDKDVAETLNAIVSFVPDDKTVEPKQDKDNVPDEVAQPNKDDVVSFVPDDETVEPKQDKDDVPDEVAQPNKDDVVSFVPDDKAVEPKQDKDNVPDEVAQPNKDDVVSFVPDDKPLAPEQARDDIVSAVPAETAQPEEEKDDVVSSVPEKSEETAEPKVNLGLEIEIDSSHKPTAREDMETVDVEERSEREELHLLAAESVDEMAEPEIEKPDALGTAIDGEGNVENAQIVDELPGEEPPLPNVEDEGTESQNLDESLQVECVATADARVAPLWLGTPKSRPNTPYEDRIVPGSIGRTLSEEELRECEFRPIDELACQSASVTPSQHLLEKIEEDLPHSCPATPLPRSIVEEIVIASPVRLLHNERIVPGSVSSGSSLEEMYEDTKLFEDANESIELSQDDEAIQVTVANEKPLNGDLDAKLMEEDTVPSEEVKPDVQPTNEDAAEVTKGTEEEKTNGDTTPVLDAGKRETSGDVTLDVKAELNVISVEGGSDGELTMVNGSVASM